MTAASVLRQLLVFTCAASAFSEANPCAVPVKPTEAPCTVVKPNPFDNPAVLGGTIAGGLAVATAVGAGIGIGVTNSQKEAEAAAKPNLRAREAPAPASPPAAPFFYDLTAPALAGATSIEVNSVAGLAAGDNIKIGTAPENFEYNKVKGFSSLILDEPLANTYANGTTITKVPASEVPAKGSSASMDWKLWLGLGLVAGGLLLCGFALAFFFCGGKKKRAKKSAPKKAPVEAVPEPEAEIDIAPLMPLLAPATAAFQYAPQVQYAPQYIEAPQYAPQVQYAPQYMEQYAPQVQYAPQYMETFQAPQVFAQSAMPVTSAYAPAAFAAPAAGVPWEAAAQY